MAKWEDRPNCASGTCPGCGGVVRFPLEDEKLQRGTEATCLACGTHPAAYWMIKQEASLRDQMAAAALQSTIAGMCLEVGGKPAAFAKTNKEYYELAAVVAYHFADAMMAVRKKGAKE